MSHRSLDQTHLVPNTLNYIIFGTLGCIPKLGFLDCVEVGKKDGLRVRAAAGAGGNEFLQIIMPRCGSILQAGTCQILSLAENPRWSRVWQYTFVTK